MSPSNALTCCSVHPLGQINVVEARSIFQDSISQIREILNAPTEDKTTRGIRTRLHEKAQLAQMLQDTRQDLQKCCQLGERHLLLHGKPSSYGENPVSFVNQFVEWMRSVAHQVGFEIDLNNSAGITDPHGDNQICMYSQALIVIDVGDYHSVPIDSDEEVLTFPTDHDAPGTGEIC